MSSRAGAVDWAVYSNASGRNHRMAITKSSASDRIVVRRGGRDPRVSWRLSEHSGIPVATLLLLIGFWTVYRSRGLILTEAEQGLAAKKLVNLNALGSRDELLPL